MKISVITVSYNSAATIERTIQSVLAQSGVSCEYIVVDGGSTDGTLEIINTYKNRIDKLICEKDKGIYDAMNKGIDAATGDIVAIINSDDFYTNADVLKKVLDCFTMGDIDACFGDIAYIDKHDPKRVVRRWKVGEYEEYKLSSGWIPPHPAFFVKRVWYDKLGGYDTRFKIAADYEWMLRCFLKGNIKLRYIKESLVYMRSGGYSALNIFQRIRGWRELRRAWTVNGKRPPFFFLTRRVTSKIHQYLV